MADIIGLYKGGDVEEFVGQISLHNKQENFLYDREAGIVSLDKNKLITYIACTLVQFLPRASIKVGVEVKAPARSRDLRIPLITLSDKKITIWKACVEITELDKTALVLEEMSDALSSITSLSSYIIHKVVLFPTRAVVSADNEVYFSSKLDADKLQGVFADELIEDLKNGSHSNFFDVINIDV